MNLLLDQGLPRSAVAHLAAQGIAAEHTGDIGLSRAADDLILEVACQKQATVVTLDADFHRLLAKQRATAPSVIRIRIEGLKGDDVASLVTRPSDDPHAGVAFANPLVQPVLDSQLELFG